jgi:hypothetical protein
MFHFLSSVSFEIRQENVYHFFFNKIPKDLQAIKKRDNFNHHYLKSMKDYIYLALYASAPPTLVIFQNHLTKHGISSVYLFSLDATTHFENLFMHLKTIAYEPKALICILLFVITVRWLFYYKSQQNRQKPLHSKNEVIALPIEEINIEEKQKSVYFEKAIDEPEWERFETMVFSSFPELKQTLVACKEFLPAVEVRISCLIRIEINKNDICILTGLSQDRLEKHLSHLRKCLNIPLNQSIDSFLLTAKQIR